MHSKEIAFSGTDLQNFLEYQQIKTKNIVSDILYPSSIYQANIAYNRYVANDIIDMAYVDVDYLRPYTAKKTIRK